MTFTTLMWFASALGDVSFNRCHERLHALCMLRYDYKTIQKDAGNELENRQQ